MKTIHIKSKPLKGVEQRFGIIVVPNIIANDAELYTSVRAFGKAEFRLFTEDNPLELEARITRLTPAEFEAFWMGD